MSGPALAAGLKEGLNGRPYEVALILRLTMDLSA